jgi:membrane associated rhomboid family serine protease
VSRARTASSLCAMPVSADRSVFTRYAVSWVFLACVCITEIVYVLLPADDRTELVRWASTSVHNLEHHPVGCLIVSAFIPTGYLTAWPALVALAMFGANHALGNWRTAVTCAAGQVIGTLVSEGIVGYRVAHGTLPPADRFLTDVGPSYVVVAAIAVALLHGGWLARGAAALDFALLIVVGQIFAGLSHLDVSAVGHVTALAVGAVLGTFLAWQRRRKARTLAAQGSAAAQ